MTHSPRPLPRQPIPPLADTLDACIGSVSPLLTPVQRLKSRLVRDLYGVAQAGQQRRLLRLAREQPTNWCAAGLTQMWLACRGGLPFANNYALLLEDDPAAAAPVPRAARLIVAALQLHQRIRAHSLAPDVVANLPLEMDQYRRCFATHRRPRLHRDEIVSTAGSHHIAVLVSGRVYCMAVDTQRGAVAVGAVMQALHHIVGDSEAAAADEAAPTLLSALPRDSWARRRGELLKHEQNRQTLALIENALFVVCLDLEEGPASPSGHTAALRDGNPHNRFYDKSMQIVVFENGKAGLCFERAAVDGSVALGFAARLHAESLRLAMDDARPSPLIRTRAAAWSLTPALRQHLTAAKKYLNDARARRSVETWTSAQLGRRRLRALGIGSDAAVQLAIQLAVSAVTGAVPKIFEPVQIRHFAGGRMDFIVPVTAESLAAVHALRTGAAPAAAAAHLRRAAKVHRHRVLRAKSGRGLVAHLLALDAVQAQDAARAGTGLRTWRDAVLSRIDEGLKATLLQQDVYAANGSGHAGVAAFCPTAPRSPMLSVGYVIGDDGITFDLRSDGHPAARARALRAALERALAEIDKALSRGQRIEHSHAGEQ